MSSEKEKEITITVNNSLLSKVNKLVKNVGSLFSSSSKSSKKTKKTEEVHLPSDDMKYNSLELNQGVLEQKWKSYTGKVRSTFKKICQIMSEEGKSEAEIIHSFEEFREVFASDIWRDFFFEADLPKSLAIERIYDTIAPKEGSEQKSWDEKINMLLSNEDISEDQKRRIFDVFKSQFNQSIWKNIYLKITAWKQKLAIDEALKKLFTAIETIFLSNDEGEEGIDEDQKENKKKLNADKKRFLFKSLNSNSEVMIMLRCECMRTLITKDKILFNIFKEFGKDNFFKLITDELNFIIKSLLAKINRDSNGSSEHSSPLVNNVHIDHVGYIQIGGSSSVTPIPTKQRSLTRRTSPTKRVSFHQRQITHTRE